MSKQQRIVYALIAVVIAVVAVVVLAAGGDDEVERAATAPVSETPTGAVQTPEATAVQESPTPAPTPAEQVIAVRGGKVSGGVQRIEVDRGDTVRFSVRADTSDHVHVHGYDKIADVAPGKRARFRFKATLVGIFEVELESAGLEIAKLRVNQ